MEKKSGSKRVVAWFKVVGVAVAVMLLHRQWRISEIGEWCDDLITLVLVMMVSQFGYLDKDRLCRSYCVNSSN